MGVATAAVVGGAVASVAGSAMQAKAANKASKRAADAAAHNPSNITGLGGGDVTASGQNINFDQNSQLTDIQKDLLNQAQASGQPLPPHIQAALDQSKADSVLNNQGLTDAANNLQIGESGLAQAQQSLQNAGDNANNLGGLLGQSAQNIAQQGPQNVQEAEFLKNRGQGLLNSNFDQQRDQQLALLREQAAPYEQQAMSSFQNDLFKRGMLNDSSGSGLLASQFSQGLARADLDRQQAAIGLGNQMTQQDRQLGANLYGQGINTSFEGQGQHQSQLNSTAGASAALGAQGSGIHQNAAALGLGFDQAQMSAAQQRIINSQNMFNFGAQAQGSQNNLTQQSLGIFQGIDDAGRASIGQSLGSSQVQNNAGANQGQFLNQQGSVWGPQLQQFGGGLMSAGINGFGGAGTQTPLPEFSYNFPARK